MNEGWIKLDRALLDWEWMTDATTLQVWIYFLLRANHEDNKWRGLTIKAGQFVSSNRKIADVLGRDRNTINQAISNLLSTGEISKQAIPNHFTIYTVVNYSKYQFGSNDGSEVGLEVGRENGRIIQPNSHPKQELKKEEERNNIVVVDAHAKENEILSEALSDEGWIEAVLMKHHINRIQFDEYVKDCELEFAASGKTTHDTIADIKYHINSFIRVKLEKQRKSNNYGATKKSNGGSNAFLNDEEKQQRDRDVQEAVINGIKRYKYGSQNS